jgi:hypothetical protein
MVRNSVKILAASLIVVGAVGVPAVSAAQESAAVRCGPGQRAVLEQRRVNGRTQVVARCEAAQRRGSVQTRQVANGSYSTAAARGSTVQYVEIERQPERSKTKTALMIAGSAATGAGVGGALNGKKGAIIGAAVGGGAASIYEAAKRR